eukprot:COSAG01_NODE_65739_length_272_cov_0.890173_1_plen_40_part_10
MYGRPDVRCCTEWPRRTWWWTASRMPDQCAVRGFDSMRDA